MGCERDATRLASRPFLANHRPRFMLTGSFLRPFFARTSRTALLRLSTRTMSTAPPPEKKARVAEVRLTRRPAQLVRRHCSLSLYRCRTCLSQEGLTQPAALAHDLICHRSAHWHAQRHLSLRRGSCRSSRSRSRSVELASVLTLSSTLPSCHALDSTGLHAEGLASVSGCRCVKALPVRLGLTALAVGSHLWAAC